MRFTYVQLVGLHYTPLFSMCVGDGGLLQHPTLGVPRLRQSVLDLPRCDS